MSYYGSCSLAMFWRLLFRGYGLLTTDAIFKCHSVRLQLWVPNPKVRKGSGNDAVPDSQAGWEKAAVYGVLVFFARLQLTNQHPVVLVA